MISDKGEMCLCVMALYNKYGEDFYGPDRHYTIRRDGDYYDLYDGGGMCCCDGETVVLEDYREDSIEVVNAEGSILVHIILFDEQFEVATGVSADEARRWLDNLR